MSVPLEVALGRVRAALLDPDGLVRAVAGGRRRGTQPRWRRAELRYVDLKAGRRLQIVSFDQAQAFTSNHAPGTEADAAVDDLLAEPFGNWHVETTTEQLQVRVTKKGEALVHATRAAQATPDTSHDRRKQRLLDEGDPVLVALGISDRSGTVKPSRQAKYRQVEEFLRALGAALDDARAAGALRTPTAAAPLTVVDLGCGNAYLTFAAHRYLTEVRGLPVLMVGVDVKAQSLEHNTEVAAELGIQDQTLFLQGAIGDDRIDAALPGPVDVVLALHACDTATDDALAQADHWQAPLVLAAPCCHHDVARQLRERARAGAVPTAYAPLLRDGILRERFADTLTDALRAETLRQRGYRVDVMEFVESRHTPRNTLIRAVRTRAAAPGTEDEVAALAQEWGLRPRLRELLR